MKAGAALLALGLLGASAALWAVSPRGSATKPASAHVQTTAARLVNLPHQGRVFLSKAQLGEALAAGTFDRPVKSLLAVSGPLHYGDYAWNDTGVPNGATWVRIDLRSQLISIFRSGHEIGTAVIVYGGDNKQTPIGRLHILAKAREHRSAAYDAEMPYTLRLTDDGVSIHGSNVRWGSATHGCIGVPLAFARRLFDASQVGDEVVIIPPSGGMATRQRS